MELLLPLDWILAGGFWIVLAKCLLVCPIIPQLLGLVFESRWVPWHPSRQFLAFMPGNPFLALFIALASTTLDRPGTDGFWQSTGFSQAVLVGSFVVYVVLNIMDLASNYTREQMASATKIYHNALYFWYGYLAVMVCSAMLASTAGAVQKALIMIPGLLWLGCLVIDSASTSPEVLEIRFKTAHADNAPVWKTRRLRRLTKDGYVSAV